MPIGGEIRLSQQVNLYRRLSLYKFTCFFFSANETDQRVRDQVRVLGVEVVGACLRLRGDVAGVQRPRLADQVASDPGAGRQFRHRRQDQLPR